MTIAISIETAEPKLKHLIEKLSLGETITLTGSNGLPLAVVVSLQPTPTRSLTISDWQAEWQAMAQAISRAWKGEKSAIETLAEMRR